jgi:hypothetical protein
MSARLIVVTVKRRGWRKEGLALLLALAAVMTSRPSASEATAGAALVQAPPPSSIAVAAVPWQASRTLPHPVTQGGTIVLQAVASNAADGNPVPLSSGTWDPGDGSVPQAIDVSNSRDLELSWAYSGAVGTSYTATISVTDANSATYTDTFSVQIQPTSLATEVNMAIDRALWYNHKAMNLDTSGVFTLGYWNDTETNASTSAAVQAFEVNGHLESGTAAADPYVDDVARGLRYLQLHLQRIGLTTLAGGGTPRPFVPFTHADASAPVDTISPNLQLSRDPSGLLLQQGSDAIEWLFGSCASPGSPLYATFDDLFWANFWYAAPTGGRYDYFSVPGQTVCLLDVTTNQAYDLTFTKWSGYFASTAFANHWDQDYYGYDYLLGVYAPLTPPGGFAYNRSQYSGGIVTVPDLQGHAGTPDDPGPDVNGNGYGLQTDGANVVYVGGQMIEAFVASGTPTATAVVGTEAGRAYADIVQDLIDAYSWGQTDPASLMLSAHSPNGNGGGWIYNWNDNFDNIDSSSSGWWGVAARAAEMWPVIVPQWVKDLNLNAGIAQLQAADGSCGYRSADDIGFVWSTMTDTTACLIMLSADGQGRASAPFVAAENWVAANYGNAFSQVPGAVEPVGSIYSMYNLTKAMRLARDASGSLAPIALLGGTIDWYGGLPVSGNPSDPHNGLAYNLVLNQRSDGKLAPQNAPGVGDGLANSWGILILSPTLFGEGSGANAGTGTATVTAGSGTKVYGQPDPTLTPTSTGFLAADGILVTETARDVGESMGSYATHATATGAAIANYSVTNNPGILMITPATPVVTASGGSFIYDGTPHAGSCSVVGAFGDVLTATISYSSGMVPTAAGSYTVSCDFAASGNYSAAVTSTATLTIAPAPSTTVVTCPASVVYTGAALTICTASVTGAGGLSQAVTPVTYTNNTNAGAAGASAAFPGDANHSASTGASSFTIMKATATCTVTGYAVTYDGAAHTTTGTCTGVGTDGTLAGVSLTGTTHTAAGTYASDAWTFTDVTGNYNNAGSTVFDSITKATPTATATGGTFIYDGTAHAGSCSIASGVVGDSLTGVISYSPGSGAPTAAGSYTVNCDFAGNSNYTAAVTGTATLTINKATATCTVTAYGDTYDGAAHTATGSCVGVGTDGTLGGLTLTGTTHTAAGNYGTDPWSFAGTSNYHATSGTVADSITLAATTTTVSCPVSVTYTGSAIAVCTAAVTGAGLNAAVTPVTYTGNTNVGTANASATYAGDPNHSGSTGFGSFAITAAATTTTVSCPVSVTYTGSAIAVCTAAVTGAGLNQAVTPVTYTGNTNVGTANANATYAGDANHSGNTGTASFVITPAATTVTVTCPASVVYTGSAIAPCTAAVASTDGLNQALTPSYTRNTNVGTATANASYTPDGNHSTSSGSANFAITPAATTVTVTCPASVVYTGLAIAPCTAAVTTVDGLNVAVTPVTYTSNTNVGTANASATYAGDTNHSGNTGTASFAITPAATTTTVTCTPAVVYTGAAQTVCIAAVTGAGGLSQAVTPVTYTNNTKVGTASASATFAGDANHSGSTGTASFAITQATINLPPVAAVDGYTTPWNTLLTIGAPGVLGNDMDPQHSALTAVLVSTTTHGSLVLSPSGGFTYVPNQNYSGIDTFSYKATDGLLVSNSVVVTITIISPCRAPVDTVHYDGDRCDHERKINGHYTGDGCAHESYDLQFDTHHDGDGCDHDRKINGHHDGDGCDHDKHNLSLRNRDYEGDADYGRSFTTYDCPSGVPIASNDAYSTHVNTVLTVSSPGVRANDTNAASVSLLTTTSNGSLALSADGSFVYTPATGFMGTETFVYVARSSTGVVGPSATVTITVVAHWVGDGCDHDKGKAPHKAGDGCAHDLAIRGGS